MIHTIKLVDLRPDSDQARCTTLSPHNSTMPQHRRYSRRRSIRISARSSDTTSNNDSRVARPRHYKMVNAVVKHMPLCLLAIMWTGINFDSCDGRASPSDVVGATVHYARIDDPRVIPPLSAPDYTSARADCRRCQDRDRLPACRVSAAECLQERSVYGLDQLACRCAVTSETAAAATAVGLRGVVDTPCQSSRRLAKRGWARKIAFVYPGGVPSHTGLDSRCNNREHNNRPSTGRDKDRIQTGRRTATAKSELRQRYRSQWNLSSELKSSRRGSSSGYARPLSTRYSPGWSAAATAAPPSGRKAKITVTKSFSSELEHPNGPLYSVQQWSAASGQRQQQQPAMTAVSSFSRDSCTVCSARNSIGDNGGGNSSKSPLLITIGPQCCGKTTLLRKLDAAGRKGADDDKDSFSDDATVTTVTDIAMDDHPTVYHKIPVARLLGQMHPADGMKDDIVQGRALSERLVDSGCQETRLVALRLSGQISAEEFRRSCREIGGKLSPAALAALSAALDSAVEDDVEITSPTADIFVVESLFPRAITSSKLKLAKAAKDDAGFVAWGNTNTKARDYQVALEQAELTGRSVRFIRWGYELPVLSLEELSRRNVYRFAATGRYVAAAAIETALERVERLYAATGGGDPAKLALAAGFHMDASGRVSSLPPTTRQKAPNKGTGAERRNQQNFDRFAQGQQAQPGDARNRNWVEGRGGERGDGRGAGDERGAGGDRSQTTARSADADLRREYRAGGAAAEGSGRISVALSGYASNGDDSVGGACGFDVSPPRSRQTLAAPEPVFTDRFSEDDAVYAEYSRATATFAVPLRLAQEWRPRNKQHKGYGESGGLGDVGAMGITSRGMAAEVKPPTVVFGNEWGRQRQWRRTDYNENDLDVFMSSCYFKPPINGTRSVRRSDEDEAGGADFEEMDLIRRIRSFRERR